MNILGRKVMLRAIEEGDLPSLQKWANDPEIADLEGSWHFPSSMEFHKEWFKALHRDRINRRFAVEVPDLGLVGYASLMAIDWKNGHAHCGLRLGDKDARGKGYGTDAMMAIMRYAFEELRLQRLESFALEYNKASLHMICQRCGWKEEGRARDRFFHRNRFWDMLFVSVTREDYFELVESNGYWRESGHRTGAEAGT